MRESKLYLQFFKKNLFLLFVPTFIGFLVGLYLFFNQPVKYKTSLAFKISERTLPESNLYSDQLVSNLRVEKYKFSNLSSGSAFYINVYKAGPDLVLVDVVTEVLQEDIAKKLQNYVEENYSAYKISENSERVSISFLYLFGPVIFGLIMGTFLSLVKEYFSNY